MNEFSDIIKQYQKITENSERWKCVFCKYFSIIEQTEMEKKN